MSEPTIYPHPTICEAWEAMCGHPIDWDAVEARARREYVDVDPDTTPEYGSDVDADRAAQREYDGRWEA